VVPFHRLHPFVVFVSRTLLFALGAAVLLGVRSLLILFATGLKFWGDVFTLL